MQEGLAAVEGGVYAPLGGSNSQGKGMRALDCHRLISHTEDQQLAKEIPKRKSLPGELVRLLRVSTALGEDQDRFPAPTLTDYNDP